MHGTHDGQLETVDGMLARAPLAGGSPKDLLTDVRWADWSSDGELAVVHNIDGHSSTGVFLIGKVLLSERWMDQQYPFLSPRGQDRIHGSSPSLGQSRHRVRG